MFELFDKQPPSPAFVGFGIFPSSGLYVQIHTFSNDISNNNVVLLEENEIENEIDESSHDVKVDGDHNDKDLLITITSISGSIIFLLVVLVVFILCYFMRKMKKNQVRTVNEGITMNIAT